MTHHPHVHMIVPGGGTALTVCQAMIMAMTVVLSMRSTVNASSPCRASGMCAGRWTSFIGRRWRRCSPHPINRRGSVAEIGRFCLLALQTGLRVSELINLSCRDMTLGTGAHIRCEGKGRKQRSTPLRRNPVKTIEAWLKERAGSDDDPVFPTIRGVWLSRDAVEHIVRKYTLAASKACATLIGKRVSPHVLRHSTAM
jgi:integrase